MSFAGFQNDIYLKGLFGELPTQPFDWRALQAAAEQVMTPGAVGYVSGGAGGEDTMRANREAFDRWRLVPQMLQGDPGRARPVGRPARHAIARPGAARPGRRAVDRARRCGAGGGPGGRGRRPADGAVDRVLDVDGGHPDRAGRQPRLVPALLAQRPGRRGLAGRRGPSAAGYRALVVTLDTWQLGWRPRDLDTAYLPFLRGEGIANYTSDPAFQAGLPAPDGEVLHFLSMFNHPALTWDDLAWLRAQTDLPIVLKGIQHPDDARRAVDAGVQGVICSNHGGRQVDGAIGSLDALPAVVEAAGDLPVLFDSGVRTGADAVKALALGARAVLLARPVGLRPGPGRAGGRRAGAAPLPRRPRPPARACPATPALSDLSRFVTIC